MLKLRKIAWVGGYPSHYVCELHRCIEKLFPGRIRFFYVEFNKAASKQRLYEKRALPDAYEVFVNHSWLSTLRLLKKVNDFNPGLIITAANYPKPVWLSGINFILRKRKVCYWSDTNLHDVFLKPFWWRFAKRVVFGLYLRRMWRLLYIGSQNRDFYIWAAGRSCFNKKGIFFPYPHNHRRYAEIFSGPQVKNDCPFTVISVGRLVAEKRFDLLVRSISLLGEEVRENIICRIAGDGPERQSLIKQAKKLKVDNIIDFAGAIPSDEIVNFSQTGDIFILPSDIEPWGIVINEMFSLGIPVVAPYWVGAAYDLVVNGVTGISLPENSPQTIAKAITRLYHNRDYAFRLGTEGRKRVKAMGYNLERTVESFCELVNDFDAQ